MPITSLRRPAREPPSVDSVVEKLIDASRVIQRRMGIKPGEEKRVKEAFTLLATGPPLVGSRGSKQRQVYLEFLQRVQKVLGLSKVVLCAAALGPSAVASMRDRGRVDLPFEMKERENEFADDILQSLADAYSADTFPQTRRNGTSETAHQELIEEPQIGISTQSVANTSETHIQEKRRTASPVSFTGDVYELTVEDVRIVAMSEPISGKIWLTDTYETNTTSFITIPVSDELTSRFIMQRPRVM